jgi:hypothetical protein
MTQLYHRLFLSFSKIWQTFLLVGFAWWLCTQNGFAQCAPGTLTISNLNCNNVVRTLPYSLNFTGNEGGLVDTDDSKQVGFTMAMYHSANRAANDITAYGATPPAGSFRGFVPGMIQVLSDSLRLVSGQGRFHEASNNQLSALGAGFQVNDKEIVIETTLRADISAPGFNGQHTGIWYGLDENNHIRLNVLKGNVTGFGNIQTIELRRELNGLSNEAEFERIVVGGLANLNTSEIRLKLIINNRNKTARAFYKVGTNPEVLVSQNGISQLPFDFGNGVNLGSGLENVMYAGILASRVNATSTFTTNFHYFKVEEVLPNLAFAPSTENVTLLQNQTKDFVVNINASDNNFPVVNLTANSGGSVPTWLKVGGQLLDGTVSQSTSTEIVFTVDANALAVNTYTATVTATSNGYISGQMLVQLTVQDLNSPNPYVISVNPPNGSINVSPIGFAISANQLYIPSGANLDRNTVNNANVKLFTVDANGNDALEIPANVNSTGGGDAINLTPIIALTANTKYRFRVSTGVKDDQNRSFIAFASVFTTGDVAGTPPSDLSAVEFTKVTNPGPGTADRFTSLVVGPDGKLYGSTLNGVIKRWTINADGTLTNLETLTPALTNRNNQVAPRLIIGLVFDPSSTAGNLIAYITHSSSFDLGAGPEWDGKVTRLTGANLNTVKDVIINLPRSIKDHLTNSLAFGTDGALYICQASNSAGGAYDDAWKRDETLLAGAILRFDFTKWAEANWPLNAQTTNNLTIINAAPANSILMNDGTYNPYATNSPLTIYASGLRNPYDMVWHSNGEIYVPTNGTAGGSNSPASVAGTRRPDGTFYSNVAGSNYPPIPAATGNEVQRDWLFKITPGQPLKYYGHPNPLRGEYVMNRGNLDVAKYPASVVADVNYGGAAFDFGFNRSPNGAIEYKSSSFDGVLKGKILVARFSGGSDIIALEPGGSNKKIIHDYVSLPGFSGFDNPLDIVEHLGSGNLYVSQYDQDKYPNLGIAGIILLKPTLPPGLAVSPKSLIINDVVDATPSANQVITISNNGLQTLQVSNISLGGVDAGQYSLNGLPTVPLSLAPNTSATFNVVFNPNSLGVKIAKVTVSSNDPIYPTLEVNLRGLGTQGLGGTNEPALQNIFNVYNIPINVGDGNINTSQIDISAPLNYNSLLGDEVSLQKFERAGSGDISIEPLAVFGPTDTNPIIRFGWYNSGTASALNELFTASNAPVANGQTVQVNINGSLSFDPGGGIPFGFYTRWAHFTDRHIYQEDALNVFSNAIPHHVRVYKMKKPDGSEIPFQYVVAFEENISGFDYQDLVFIVKNVKPYIPVVIPTLVFNPNQKSILLNTNTLGVFQADLTTSNNQIADMTLSVNYQQGSNWLSVANLNWNTLFTHNPSSPSITFNVNTGGLSGGVYKATISAISNGYVAGNLALTLVVSSGGGSQPTLQVNFQTQTPNPAPTGWLRDFGQAYANRGEADQGNGTYTYGWIREDNGIPLDLSTNGLIRGSVTPAQGLTFVLRTTMRMQRGTTFPNGAWEISVPNGYYNITATVGDSTGGTANPGASNHVLNVETENLLNFSVPAIVTATTPRLRTASKIVFVTDGKLTLDAKGGTNTKLVSAVIAPFNRQLTLNPTALDIVVDYGQSASNQTFNISTDPGNEVYDLALTKSAGMAWLSVPISPIMGSNTLGIDVTGLLPGVYEGIVTASASGFSNALLPIKLTVKSKTISFNPTVLNFTLVQGGTATPQNADLISDGGTAPVTLSVAQGGQWVVLPSNPQFGTLAFGVNAGGLAPGNYTTKVTANSAYGAADLTINLTVTRIPITILPSQWDYRINFQPGNGTAAIPAGWVRDLGTAYPTTDPVGSFGWLNGATKKPQANDQGLARAGAQPYFERSFNRLQGPTFESLWEIRLNPGCYYVKVSVGDLAGNDGIHIINAEGTKLIDYNQKINGQAGIRQDSAVVEVLDGKLTIDAYGGLLTKINYIWIEPINPTTDIIPPIVNIDFNGVQEGAFVYRNPLVVYVNPTDAGCSGIASIEYNLNNAGFKPYTTPLVITEAGNYTLSAKVVDNQGNTSISAPLPFRVVNVAKSNAKMILRNMIGFPGPDDYTFSFLMRSCSNPDPEICPFLKGPYYDFPGNINFNRDANIIRVYNRGTGALNITNLELTNNVDFRIDIIRTQRIGSGAGRVPLSTVLPINVPAGDSVDVTIAFVARNYNLTPAQRIKIFHEKLNIYSTDDATPFKPVNLHGVYQELAEGGDEPRTGEMIDAAGFRTQTGYEQTNENHAMPIADEIFSDYFIRADSRYNIRVWQAGSYHTLGDPEFFRTRLKGQTGFGALRFSHLRKDSQTLVPNIATGGGSPTLFFQIPNGMIANGQAFAVRIGRTTNINNPGDDTDPTQSNYFRLYPNLCKDPQGNPFRSFRIWKARDWNGNLIPNAYFMAHDYLYGNASGVSSNFDYNDNLYYLTNIRPELGTDYVSELAAGVGQSALDFTAALEATQTLTLNLRSLGQTFANGADDPEIKIQKIEIVGQNLEEFYFSQPLDKVLSAGEQTTMTVSFRPLSVGVKNAALLIYYDLTTPLRVPLYGTATSPCFNLTLVKRLKAPTVGNSGPNVNAVLYGVTYESDRSYVANSSLGQTTTDYLGQPSEIVGTDLDLVYSSQRSSNRMNLPPDTDLGFPINYAIPGLTNGEYIVRLMFAENTWSLPALRVQNIFIENQPALLGFDIFNEVGYKTAIVKDFNVTLTDGTMNINLVPVKNRPAISGIELYRISRTTTFTLTTANITGASCGTTNGSVTLQVNNTPPATTMVYKLGKFGTYQPSPIFSNLASGTYTFYTKEDKLAGCETQVNVVVPPLANTISFQVSTTPVICGQPNSGTATISNITGGTEPYTVTWNTIPVRSGNLINGLPAGNIQVTVTDGLGCIRTQTINIPNCGATPNQPPYIVNAIPDYVVLKNSGQIIINLNAVFADNETAQLVYSVNANSNTSLVNAQIAGNFLLLNIIPQATGVSNLTIRATDGGNLFVDDAFMLTVLNTDIVVTQIQRPLLRGATDKVILGMVVSNPTNLVANSFTFNTNGSSNASDVAQAKLYRTTTPLFINPTLIGSGITNPNGQFTFSGLTTNLALGNNYFWLAYDVSASAGIGNDLDAELVSVILSGNQYLPVNGNPNGARKIFGLDQIPGYVLQFDGIDDAVKINQEEIFDFTSSVGVEAWIRINQFDNAWQTIISKGNSWALQRFNTTNQLNFEVAGVGNVTSSNLININDGQWHHVAGMYSGSSLDLYIDGELAGSAAAAGSITTNDAEVWIGGNQLVGGRQFNGLVDEVRIWNTARTTQQIRESMNLTLNGSESGLVAYFQMNEGNGLNTSDFVDGSTGILVGEMTNANWVLATIPIGAGVVNSSNTAANTTITFGLTGLQINFGANHPQGIVVVTRIDNVGPAGTEAGVGFSKTASYWIIRNYGLNKTMTNAMKLKFNVPAGYIFSGNPGAYKLFKRNSNAVGSWSIFDAIAVDNVNNTLEFGNVFSFSQAIIGSNPSPLPVSLISFEGKRIGSQQVELTWRTAQEINNRGFEVQRSLDNQQFEAVGFVDGAGNSNITKSYRWTDNNPQSAYYRLKQIDFDGKFEYSRQVFVAATDDQEFKVFPNPWQAGKGIEFTAPQVIQKQNNLRMQVINAMGKTMWEAKGNLNELKTALNQNIDQLAVGVYTMRVYADNRVYVVKLVKNQ